MSRKCHFVLAFFLVSSGAAAASCDPALSPIADPVELAYQDRGGRCEGLYVQNISTSGLRLIGYHLGQQGVVKNARVLEIQAGGNEIKQLRISSTRPRQYYRMDAQFDGGRYLMSLDLARLPEIRLKPEEMAALSCVATCGTLMPTLVPTRLGARETAKEPFIILQANKDLYGLKVEVTDQATNEVIFSQDLLGSVFWQAWRPAEIPVGQFFKRSEAVVLKIRSRGRVKGQFDTVMAVLRP
ncbi:MAG: hypothetical protein P1V13_13725 [Rhizobiaceae bacterium]|nr:hypothetical protein [Rhizobiaceae bacterium]